MIANKNGRLPYKIAVSRCSYKRTLGPGSSGAPVKTTPSYWSILRSLSCLIMALFNSAIAIFSFHFSLRILKACSYHFSSVIIALHKYKMTALKIKHH